MTTKTEGAVFRSSDQNLRLVVEPATEQIDATGRRIPVPGKTIEFVKGEYQPKDADEAAFLREHRLKDSDFVEVGSEPGRPKPEAEEVIGAIFEAALAGKIEEVKALRQVELAGHSRPVVLASADKALNQLGDPPPQPPIRVAPEELAAQQDREQAEAALASITEKPKAKAHSEGKEKS
jgi:hypothetical protein